MVVKSQLEDLQSKKKKCYYGQELSKGVRGFSKEVCLELKVSPSLSMLRNLYWESKLI